MIELTFYALNPFRKKKSVERYSITIKMRRDLKRRNEEEFQSQRESQRRKKFSSLKSTKEEGEKSSTGNRSVVRNEEEAGRAE